MNSFVLAGVIIFILQHSVSSVNDEDISDREESSRYNIDTGLCELLLPPQNAEINVTRSQDGPVATYRCVYGQLVGDSARRCRYDGKWSGQEPECIGGCDPLQSPENGQISFSMTKSNDGSLPINSKAIYRCNKGYKVMGHLQLECVNPGNWNKQPPDCIIAGAEARNLQLTVVSTLVIIGSILL